MTNPEKIREEALFYLVNKTTIRVTAEQYGISKTSIYQHFSRRLENIDRELYEKVKLLMEKNRKEAPMRGGLAIRRKFLESQKKKN